MNKQKFLGRLRYLFDNTMSRGPAGLILWLGLVTVVLVVTATVVVLLLGNDPDKDFFSLLWDVVFQTLTPNPVDPKAGSVGFLGTMFLMTLGSLFLVSIFIGILTNAIDHRIQNLRKGRSTVYESGHTLILGWSSQIFTIVSELVRANESRRYSCIVVLADRDKVEMEDDLHDHVPRRGRTRIVCRTGSPIDVLDLEIVNPHTARSIIILPPEIDDPDSFVIKTILALTNSANRKLEPYHIVAAIHEAQNMEVARMVGREEVELVLVSDLISRAMVQASRQAGLSAVYTELLDFEGDEIYFQEERALVGQSLCDALLAYEDSSVIGLWRSGGAPQLNPPLDTPIQPGDQIIAISRDDDTVKLSGLTRYDIDERAIQSAPATEMKPERMLILGWNRDTTEIINQLDNYVAPGSETVVVALTNDAPRQIQRECSQLRNQTVTFTPNDTTDRAVLNDLAVPSFNHVLVLSYSDMHDAQAADARTLLTLLHLRDIRERAGKDFTIVSEMLDVRNRILADVTRADDFIVSDQLISLVLAQVSENKYLNALLADLFDPEGSEIYLKPAQDYVELGKPVNMYTVVEAARRREQIAIGYRLRRWAHDAAKNYGVAVNPLKSNPLTFEPGDRVIVISES